MIHAYIGDGKGKTTAAVGLAVRAAGAGRRVGVVLFDKGSETYRHNELVAFDKLGIEYHVTGNERMKPDGSFRFENIVSDVTEADRGLKLAADMVASGGFDLLVLDEALSAVTYGMLDKSELLGFIKSVPATLELVLTGRCDDEEILGRADLVTCMQKRKHYFDQGAPARPGIEY